MGLETVTYISDLNPLWPLGRDPKSNGDNHLQNIKKGLLNTFAAITGAVTATHVEINYLSGVTSNVQVQLDAKANTASPTFTGTVVLPAATSIGTVTAAELLTLSGVSSAIQTQLNGKGAIAGQAWSGAHDFTTGSINVPTATAGDSSTNAASTAFVAGVAFSAALPGQSGNAGRFVKTDGSSASWSSAVGDPVEVGSPTNAVNGGSYVFTASTTLTLPASPSNGDWVRFANQSATITPTVARNGSNIMSIADDLVVDFENIPLLLVYINSTRGWVFL